jgi:hypothetical protein
MKPALFSSLLCLGLLNGQFSTATAAVNSQNETSSSTQSTIVAGQTVGIVRAAQALLDSFDSAQRAKVVFQFDDKEQRARWSNLPTSMVARRGLRMGDLTVEQRTGVMALLSAALSKMGYEKIVGIIEADEVLKGSSGGGGPAFGRNEFYVSFLGVPSMTSPWMLQFGGHHLALNLTFLGEAGVITPSLIAVQPARYQINGRTVRPLGRETDKAFELIGSLDPSQRKVALLGFEMHDLVLGPGHDGETIQPEGIKASALKASQQQMLLELIAEWSGIIHDAAAAQKMSEVKANLPETWFSWSGPTDPGSAAYFRVQGPTVMIEYAPQKLGGDPTQHIHTMYRDFTNDYGKKLLSR